MEQWISQHCTTTSVLKSDMKMMTADTITNTRKKKHTQIYIYIYIYTHHSSFIIHSTPFRYGFFISAISMVAFPMSLILTIGQPDNTPCGAEGQREHDMK
jgi:hypothetical protein